MENPKYVMRNGLDLYDIRYKIFHPDVFSFFCICAALERRMEPLNANKGYIRESSFLVVFTKRFLQLIKQKIWFHKELHQTDERKWNVKEVYSFLWKQHETSPLLFVVLQVKQSTKWKQQTWKLPSRPVKSMKNNNVSPFPVEERNP